MFILVCDPFKIDVNVNVKTFHILTNYEFFKKSGTFLTALDVLCKTICTRYDYPMFAIPKLSLPGLLVFWLKAAGSSHQCHR